MFTSSDSYVLDGAATPGQARVVGIKGWYDEQELAWNPPEGTAIPSHIKGTVIPHPDLGLKTFDAFASGTWVPVAYVALDTTGAVPGAVPYYQRKLNLEPIKVQLPLERLNQVYSCYGTREHCRVPASDPSTGTCGKETNFARLPVRFWWAKIESAQTHTIHYRCITQRDHKQALATWHLAMPGTARFRWLLGDETIWVECTGGCCEAGTRS
jgi:hypothetical protein